MVPSSFELILMTCYDVSRSYATYIRRVDFDSCLVPRISAFRAADKGLSSLMVPLSMHCPVVRRLSFALRHSTYLALHWHTSTYFSFVPFRYIIIDMVNVYALIRLK